MWNWRKETSKSDFILLTFIQTFQSFGGRPSVFVSAKYTRDTKSKDAMYVWLENVNSGNFEVCIREFLPFDGKHQDTIVVSNTSFAVDTQPYMVCKVSQSFVLSRKRRLFHLRPTIVNWVQCCFCCNILIVSLKAREPQKSLKIRGKKTKNSNIEESYHKIQIRTAEMEFRLTMYIKEHPNFGIIETTHK